jgi:hypothetical protein
MVRFLIVLLLTPQMGAWETEHTKKQIKCPSAEEMDTLEPVKLGAGCIVPISSVGYGLDGWLTLQGDLGARDEEIKQLKARLKKEEARTRDAERRLSEAIGAHSRDVALLRSLKTPKPRKCAFWVPRAEGALFAGALCGGAFIGSIIAN